MPVKPWTWAELADETLRRQFPRTRGLGPPAVLGLVGRAGPIQSQAARAPFLALASRLPGATHQDISHVHESLELVRSTSLRGTVHTSTATAHAALHAVSARAQAALWRRTLGLDAAQLDAFRARLDQVCAGAWVTHDVVETALHAWFDEHGLSKAKHATTFQVGRVAFKGQASMLRCPRSAAAGWDSQADVVYRSASAAIAEVVPPFEQALVELVRHHIAASGPVSRRDLAWWSGAGLRDVDAAVASLGDELTARPGPNGLDYLDLCTRPRGGGSDPGLRLLPEYDALLLAYDPKARERFADERAIAHSWNRANGVHSPTVLVDGRIRGRWRLERSGRTGSVIVETFAWERPIEESEVADQARAVGTALAVEIADVRVHRASG